MAFVATAVVAAVELGTIAAIATAAAEVGLALTVVGTVTKSKELTGLGKVLSIAGGVTSLAAGAYSAFGAEAAGAAGGTSAAAGAAEGAAATGGAETFAVSVPTAADFAPVTNEGIVSGANAANATSGVANAAPAALPGDAAAGTLGSTPQASTPLSATPQASTAAPTAFASGDVGAAAKVLPPVDTSQSGIARWWSGLDDKAKNTILQTGAGAVGGLFNGWSAEQRNALERDKLALSQAQYNKQVSNAAYVPSIRYQPTGGGMMNTPTGGT